jgi:hypothetical protein
MCLNLTHTVPKRIWFVQFTSDTLYKYNMPQHSQKTIRSYDPSAVWC